MNDLKSANIISTIEAFGFKYWEIQLFFKNGEIKFINVSLETMKPMGITKRIDGFSKVEKFLNSKSGLKWIEENMNKMNKKQNIEYL